MSHVSSISATITIYCESEASEQFVRLRRAELGNKQVQKSFQRNLTPPIVGKRKQSINMHQMSIIPPQFALKVWLTYFCCHILQISLMILVKIEYFLLGFLTLCSLSFHSHTSLTSLTFFMTVTLNFWYTRSSRHQTCDFLTRDASQAPIVSEPLHKFATIAPSPFPLSHDTTVVSDRVTFYLFAFATSPGSGLSRPRTPTYTSSWPGPPTYC